MTLLRLTGRPFALTEAGGKAVAVQRLAALGLRVPPSLVLSTACMSEQLARAFTPAQQRRLATAFADSTPIDEWRARFFATPVPTAWLRAVRRCFPRAPLLMVRSSGVGEDGETTSLAGHYLSQISINQPRALTSTLQQVWWQGLVTHFRLRAGPHDNPWQTWKAAASSLAALIQVVRNAEKSGVTFSRSPFNAQTMMTVANWGTCHGVVDGTLPTDTFLTREGRHTAELNYKFEMSSIAPTHAERWPGELVSTQLGTTFFHRQHSPYVDLVRVPRDLGGWAALWEEELDEVTATVARLAESFGHEVDVEWTYDEGDLTILQARPITAAVQPTHTLAAGQRDGVIAAVGRASGPVRVLRSVEDIERVQIGDVMVVGATDPVFLPAFRRAVAVISEEGSPLSHTAIVARELGLPCLVDVADATRGRFSDGQVVTVDARRGRICAGGRASRRRQSAPRSTPPEKVAWHLGSLPHLRPPPRAIAASALLDAYLCEAAPGAETVAGLLAFRRRVAPGLPVEWDLTHPSLGERDLEPFLLAAAAALLGER